MASPYHYPPELFQLLVDTIPRLCKSKRDVFTFFRGAGVEESLVSDIRKQWNNNRDSVSKSDIVHTVLERLNEGGDKYLTKRREVLKLVVETEDFSTSWPDDRLVAQGLVSRVRDVVNVRDSFTRMHQEREAEVRKHREAKRIETAELNEKQEQLATIHRELFHLFAVQDAHERGRLLEGVLNRLFEVNGILVKEDFRRKGEPGQGTIEQLDGVIQLDGHIYLVEMKWLGNPIGKAEISPHLVNVMSRGGAARGIFISYRGYTEPAIQTCTEFLNNGVVVLCKLEEIVHILESESNLTDFLRKKIEGSIVNKRPFTEVISTT